MGCVYADCSHLLALSPQPAREKSSFIGVAAGEK